MLQLAAFTFNPYQENTYVLYDQGQALIVDPGMYTPQEEMYFVQFLEENALTPTALLNTHCHIDHVLGNHFIHEKYGLKPQFHEMELPVWAEVQNYAPQMGFRYEPSPLPEGFLPGEGLFHWHGHDLHLIFAPGHSPGHLCFYLPEQHLLLGGDVLFQNSIGRTDLPGGNHEQLLNSIRQNLYTLPPETVVYPGHGPSTTIGHEMKNNPFVRA
jgi:hydroxyacylglutathione hydrolase